MLSPRAVRPFAVGLVGLLANGIGLAATRPKPHKSPHVEIRGEARVETAPQRTVHKNGRAFLEFEITLQEARATSEQPADADRSVQLDTAGRVRVVHDLACGGSPLSLALGDRIEIQGEYVKIPRGGDLIHFTHAADGSCGSGAKRPSGYIRKLAARAAPTPARAPGLRPAAVVPDQPFVGTPRPAEKAYIEIGRLKKAGKSDEALIEKIRTENIRYSLTTYEIQELRADGLTERVIEAMLRSGRSATTSTPREARTPTPH